MVAAGVRAGTSSLARHPPACCACSSASSATVSLFRFRFSLRSGLLLFMLRLLTTAAGMGRLNLLSADEGACGVNYDTLAAPPAQVPPPRQAVGHRRVSGHQGRRGRHWKWRADGGYRHWWVPAMELPV